MNNTLFNDLFTTEREVATLEAELRLARERVNFWELYIEGRRCSLSVAKLKLADLKEESAYKRIAQEAE